jgi:Fe-S cluster assembly protein SufD
MTNRFSEYIRQLFQENLSKFPCFRHIEILKIKENAMQVFMEKGFSDKEGELWKNIGIDDIAENSYQLQLEKESYYPVNAIFKCQIPNLNANTFVLINGFYHYQHSALTTFPNGLIVGSLNAAIQEFPDLVLPYLAQQDLQKTDTVVAMNEAFFSDGIFIYVPDHVIVERPVQMLSLVNSERNLLVQNRNVVVLGQNSQLSLIQCNDSIRCAKTLINNVTEIHLAKNAQLNYYKTENKDVDSILIDHIFVYEQSNANFMSNIITFNAGYIFNVLNVSLLQPHATARLSGLYLVDKKQFVENHLLVNHIASNCNSQQLYKGIADDAATAVFNGHIVVAQDAQKTAAFQVNKNIVLTDEAHVITKPFLEIYADDVQCSHGATVGQLDDDALFYLRSRGICEKNARKLLLYAFANEVVNKVEIVPLRTKLLELVYKRLSGELHSCEQCVLHCSRQETISFDMEINV